MDERDGSHDFDLALGSWDLTLKRRNKPLTGSSEWAEFRGRTTCRAIAENGAQAEEFHAENPTDGSTMAAVTLRFYDVSSQEWSLSWVNRTHPAIGTPQKGRFADGLGEFLDRDTVNGTPVVVRYLWSRTESDSPHFEQAFSTDDGATWETNWVTDQTRAQSP